MIGTIDSAAVRRGAIFLVNIGVPLLVGAITGQSQAALAAVIVGMLFGFADNDGPLLGRLRLLLLDAGCITAGGLIGYFSRSDAAVLWPLFITITFAVGLAARTGREWLLAGRHTAMAFVVTAAVPTFSLLEVWYLLGVTLLAAATRSVDYLIAGPLPRQPAAPMQVPSGHAGWLRFAVAHAGAATAALWLPRPSTRCTPSGSSRPRSWSWRDLAELHAEGIAKLLPARVIDMLIGCAIALVGTAVAFPRAAVADAPVAEPKGSLAVNRDDGSD
jgi:hypothetical protein